MRGRRAEVRLALFSGAIASAVLIVFWGIAWIWLGTPLAFFRPADDAYYYLDVAARFVHGQGMSTDGMHTTNGYHPLWMLILLPFAGLFDAPSQSFVVSAQLLSFLFFGAAVAGMVATARRAGLTAFAAVTGALFLFLAPWRGIVGAVVEGGVALALLAWMAFAAQRLRDRITSPHALARAGLGLGVLAGLAVLARLDSAWLVGVVCLAAVWWVLRSTNLDAASRRRVVAAILGLPAVLLGSYVALNLSTFGHALPISGEIKTTFPVPRLSLGHLQDSLRGFGSYYILLPIAWLGVLGARARRMPVASLLLVLTLGATVQAAYLLLFARGIFWWHFVSLLPAGLLAISVLVDIAFALSSSRRMHATTGIALSFIIAIAIVAPLPTSLLRRSQDGNRVAVTGWRIEAERAAEWTTTHLSSGVVLAMRDSGAFGYYARQPVMNLDGVISNYDYQDALCAGGLIDELRRSKVRYVAYHAVKQLDYEDWELPIPCSRDNGMTTSLRFQRSDEVYRSRPYWHGQTVVFVIWQLKLA